MSHQRLGNEDQFKGTGKASGEDIGVRATMEARMMKPFAAALSIAALITSQPAQARTVGMVCTGAPLQSDGSIPANAARGKHFGHRRIGHVTPHLHGATGNRDTDVPNRQTDCFQW